MVVFVETLTLTGSEQEFDRIFAHIAEFMRSRPGFVRYLLVRSRKQPGIYFNVAEWEDVESFQRAVSDPEFMVRLGPLKAVVEQNEMHMNDVVRAGAPKRTADSV